ncbi:hypothetical protein PN36_15545 [Candidatus Thiomargarita nelsonii]|uniref:Uncharacterized protein n=1 Tax=Candidatus Thiomargarita nelsonii TaxID=1003181 RepID=A0A0A6P6U6_9GAMM|nr:hypothetical protein PN36_15545 [Candidatus Thiomargarita nelsonii]
MAKKKEAVKIADEYGLSFLMADANFNNALRLDRIYKRSSREGFTVNCITRSDIEIEHNNSSDGATLLMIISASTDINLLPDEIKKEDIDKKLKEMARSRRFLNAKKNSSRSLDIIPGAYSAQIKSRIINLHRQKSASDAPYLLKHWTPTVKKKT